MKWVRQHCGTKAFFPLTPLSSAPNQRAPCFVPLPASRTRTFRNRLRTELKAARLVCQSPVAGQSSFTGSLESRFGIDVCRVDFLIETFRRATSGVCIISVLRLKAGSSLPIVSTTLWILEIWKVEQKCGGLEGIRFEITRWKEAQQWPNSKSLYWRFRFGGRLHSCHRIFNYIPSSSTFGLEWVDRFHWQKHSLVLESGSLELSQLRRYK